MRAMTVVRLALVLLIQVAQGLLPGLQLLVLLILKLFQPVGPVFLPALLFSGIRGQTIQAGNVVFVAFGIVGFITLQWLL